MMKEQRTKRKNLKRWFSILLTAVFCFTLLPATAYAAGTKAQLDTITTNWNKTTYSQSNSFTNTKYQYSGAYQCQAFSRYIFNNLYGHTDGLSNKNNTVTITNHSTASSLLNQLKTKAQPGDAIRVTAPAYGGSHIMHLYQIDSSNQIHVYESNYDGTTNKGRYHIYPDIATFVDHTMRLTVNKKSYKVTVSNDKLSYKVELKIIHSKHNNGNSSNNSSTATVQEKQLISNGTYTLTPKHASGMRLDIASASTSNKANVQIYKANDTNAQKFTFKHLGNNYYSITNVNSGKVLDVTGGSSTAGANVQQYGWANVPAQRWKVTKTSDGYFYLSPDTNENLALDVNKSGKTNGTNVLVWTNCATDNQKWKLTSAAAKTTTSNTSTTTTKAPSTKTYYVYNTDGTLVMRKGPGSGYAQQALIPEGAAVTVTPSKNSGSWWHVTYNGKSGYSYGKYLTATKPTAIIKDGTYEIAPNYATNMRLDVSGASTANGANVQIYTSNGTNAQKWKFKHLGNDYYTITCVASGKVLDVKDGNSKPGANVQQWGSNNSNAQIWKVKSAGNGCYYICPKLNESVCLDVYKGGKTNSTNVTTWTNNGAYNQKWKLY